MFNKLLICLFVKKLLLHKDWGDSESTICCGQFARKNDKENVPRFGESSHDESLRPKSLRHLEKGGT